jgi:hypothetical protein
VIELNPDTVRFIIDKAREFQTHEDLDLSDAPDSLEIGDWSDDVLSGFTEDFTYQELESTIDDLEPDQQVNLVGLMWLGRGDYSADDWDKALADAGSSWNQRTAEYLIGTPLLADYLEEGLERLGFSAE